MTHFSSSTFLSRIYLRRSMTAAFAVAFVFMANCGFVSLSSDPFSHDDASAKTDSSITWIIEVGSSDSGSNANLCGEPKICSPESVSSCQTLMSKDASVDSETSDAAPSQSQACRVVFNNGKATSQCMPSGSGGVGFWCQKDSDCGAGLACVGEPGRCLFYCCATYGTSIACDAKQYCSLLPLAETKSQRVPVWVPLDRCELLADLDKCPTGSTCGVVSNCGPTTCLPIGTGRDFDACDEETFCDRGYACLGIGNARQCRRVCKEKEPTTCKRGEQCVGSSSSLPSGFGICVLTDAGAGL